MIAAIWNRNKTPRLKLTTFMFSSGSGASLAEIPLHKDMASKQTTALSNASIAAQMKQKIDGNEDNNLQ